MLLREAAEMYHSMGMNVLPIKYGKKPYIDWDRLQTERQSLEEVRSYDWDGCRGLGIMCGVNGYVCIDIDHAKDATVVAEILKVLNLTEEYSWVVRSGSGTGYHIWVRLADPLPFQKGVLWGISKNGTFDHIEIRWRECQTLVPPSLHPEGNVYSWIGEAPIDEPMLVPASSVLEAFELVAYLKQNDPNEEKPKYKKTEYTDIIANGVVEGRRNDTLASLSGHFRKNGLNFSEALEVLNMWNARLAQPLPVEEVETTVTSIYSYPSTDIVLRDGMEMNLMPTPVLHDIVEGVIGEKSFNFLAGEEGAGKSLLAMNMSLAIATGAKQFLGYEIKKHGKVLYLNNELPFAVFLQRFKRMRTGFAVGQAAHLGNFLTPEFIHPLAESWDDIVKIIQQHQPVLVVLDCLYFAHNKKENDSSDMKDVMRQLISLRDLYGVAVTVVHHTKKGVRHDTMHNDNIRGSQVFSASADTNILFKRSEIDESKRLFKLGKLRNGDDDMRKVHLLALNSGDLWFQDLGEVNEEDHIAAAPENRKARAQGKIDWDEIFSADKVLERQAIIERCLPLQISARSVDRALKKAVNDEILDMPKQGRYVRQADKSAEQETVKQKPARRKSTKQESAEQK